MSRQEDLNRRLIVLLAQSYDDGEKKLSQVKYLLQAGADPNARDSRGHPALFLAVGRSNANITEKMVNCLIDGGANPNAVLKENVRSAFFYVYETHAVQALVNGGADITQPDQDGVTPQAYYQSILQGESELALTDPRNRDKIRWIGSAVDAVTWMEQAKSDGNLTYSGWLSALNEIEKTKPELSSEEYHTKLYHMLQNYSPILKYCEEKGGLSREELLSPESCKWIGQTMGRFSAFATEVLQLCDKMGAPLDPRQARERGMFDYPSQSGNAHFLFGHTYWQDKPFPEMIKFFRELPEDQQVKLLRSDRPHASLFVPHLCTWLASLEMEQKSAFGLMKALQDVPDALLDRVSSRKQLIQDRISEEQSQQVGRA